MLIIDLTYKKPIEEVDKHLVAHRDFLEEHYRTGIFIASGPKDPRDGGVIIALAEQPAIEDIIKNDPFYQHGIADYQITEFIPVKYCDALKPLL